MNVLELKGGSLSGPGHVSADKDMNVLELKGSIIDLIAHVKDAELLEELNNLIKNAIRKNKEKGDWWDELTTAQQKELDKALEASYDESNWVADEEAQVMIQQWLDK